MGIFPVNLNKIFFYKSQNSYQLSILSIAQPECGTVDCQYGAGLRGALGEGLLGEEFCIETIDG